MLYLHHLYHIPVGDETRFGALRQPKVIVLEHHQQIARHKFALVSKDTVTDFVVEQVGAFVGACDAHDILPLSLAVFFLQNILQFGTVDTLKVHAHIFVRLQGKEGKTDRCVFLLRNFLAQERGVFEHQRPFSLPHHLV